MQLKPSDVELWVKLGAALLEFGRPADALMTYPHALKLSPRQWDAAYGSRSIFHQLGRFEEAIKQFGLCRELRLTMPRRCNARVSPCIVSRFEECLADSMAAHALDPNRAERRANMGTALRRLAGATRRRDGSTRLLRFRLNLAEALNNKAVSLGNFTASTMLSHSTIA